MSADLQTVARFSDQVEAQLTCNRLVDEGLNAVIVGDLSTNVLGLGIATGGIEVLVPAAELERAQTILESIEKEVDAVHHPRPEAITADLPPPEYSEEPLTEEERRAEPTPAEELTDRAFRASLFGYIIGTPMFPVVHLYTIMTLIVSSLSGGAVRGEYSTKYYLAFGLSAVSVILGWLFYVQFEAVAAGAIAMVLAGIVAVVLFLFLKPLRTPDEPA